MSLSEKFVVLLGEKAMTWDKVMKISLSQRMINSHKSFFSYNTRFNHVGN